MGSNGGTTASCAANLTAAAQPALTITRVDIQGSAELAPGDVKQFKLAATYSDGSTLNVTASKWSIDKADVASISSAGALTIASALKQNASLTVSAIYEKDGKSYTDSFAVAIKVSADQGSFKLDFTSGLENGPKASHTLKATLTVTDPAEIGRSGAIFVVAYLPQFGFFSLSGSSGTWSLWDGMATLASFSLPASLGTHELTILSNADITVLPPGTEVYVSYGFGLGLPQAQQYMIEKARFGRVATF